MTAADTPPPSDLVWPEYEGGGGGEGEDAGGSAGGKATDATTLSAASSISSVAATEFVTIEVTSSFDVSFSPITTQYKLI